MHKRFVNHCTIQLTISPQGPILIKAGKEGADPTKPDMEFVETYHQGGKSIYLPGSSLKGAIRAHAERIVRTVGKDKRPPEGQSTLWSSDPLSKDDRNNPNLYLEAWKKDHKDYPDPGVYLYKESCFISKIFGNTSLSSRLRIEDAYPIHNEKIKIEERNGVAIDRVFGSAVPGALFNFQVCTEGEFKTKIHLKNFSLAQLGLIVLTLRDLDEGWFGLGFAKSRGLGLVNVQYEKAVVQYPGCFLVDKQIKPIGSPEKVWAHNTLIGAGEFLGKNGYEFPETDRQAVAISAQPMDLGVGVQMTWHEDEIENLFISTVDEWRKLLGIAA